MVSAISIILLILGSLIGSAGTVIIKKGTQHHSFFRLFFTPFLWTGGFCYALSVVMYVFVLRAEELSVVYPLVSLSYLWTTLFSVQFLGEKMNPWKWRGLLGIIIGVVLIGMGS